MMGNIELPRGWVRTRLGQVVNYGSVKKIEFASVEQDAWTLELEDIEKDTSRILKKISVSERPFKSTKNIFHKGDVLYGKLRPYLNKIVLANNNGICSTEIVPINAEPWISNYYLFYWLKGCEFSAYVNNVSYGVNMPRLGTKDGNLAPLILPPLAEQKEIVRIIESHLQLVDQIKSRLDALPKILEQFRQSVLASAVSGDENYKKEKLENVINFINGFAFKSTDFKEMGEYQVIRLGNVKDNYLRTEANPVFISKNLVISNVNAIPQMNDILITMTGTRYKKDYGFVYQLNEDHKIVINQRVGIIRNKSEKVYSSYLYLWLRSESFRQQFFQGETGGVNQGNVGSTHIKNCIIKLPTFEEQKEIVKRVENLFALADQVESKIKNAQERVNLLTQSILAKAFRGEFTAKWREDNPDLISGENSADALLTRIEEAKKGVKKTR